MKRASFIAAAAIVVVANALALVHAARNRTGTPDAEMTLTQRELRYFNRSAADEDSGVSLYLEWIDPGNFPWPWPGQLERSTIWLDRTKLQSLGFGCSVDAASPDAGRYYQRQRPRQVFVALEYEGAAWRAWAESYNRVSAEQKANKQFSNWTDDVSYRSHLFAVDADIDPIRLRGRHPDRTAVVIVPAVVSVTLEPFPYPGTKPDSKRSPQVIGRIQQLPSSIHVPRPFSDEFRRLNRPQGEAWNKDLLFRVHLRYGASREPWITGVEFVNGQ
jgi:hypothetical protein